MREYADQDVVGLINRMEIELLTKQNRLDLALSRINGLIVSAKTNADGGMSPALDLSDSMVLLLIAVHRYRGDAVFPCAEGEGIRFSGKTPEGFLHRRSGGCDG